MYVQMKHKETGDVVERKLGGSWLISFILIIIILPVGLFRILLMFSNKTELKELIQKGYLPANKYSLDVLKRNGFIFKQQDSLDFMNKLEKKHDLLTPNSASQLPVINKNIFIVREIPEFTAYHRYDFLDPDNNKIIMECRETGDKNLKILQNFFNPLFSPFNLTIKSIDGFQILRISKPTSFSFEVLVFDEYDKYLCLFSKFILKGFVIFAGGKTFEIKGNWGREFFRFIEGDTEYAHVLFEKEDIVFDKGEYHLVIHNNVPPDSEIRKIIIAATLCKEIYEKRAIKESI
jgi:hypothetical protein